MTEPTPQNETPEEPALAIPEKFKNAETGELNVEALLNSYTALEKKLSEKPSAPALPASAEEYCVNCDHGLFEVDPEINARLHAKGMNEEQVQEVYDLAAEKIVPMINEVAGDYNADRELEKIENHFGGKDAWKAIAPQLLKFGQKNLPADVLDNLSSSHEGIIALHNMMHSGEPTLQKRSDNPSKMGELDLQSMMRDPKYWRDKDPAYVAKVTQGFEKMYGK
ncbi:MAG: capsid assembly protein [Alphaproteobacteria bacterium]